MLRPLVVGFTLLAAVDAQAHFVLMSPENAKVQNDIGDPQKTPPCGGNGTDSNAVTELGTGSMVSITIDETITHPGHYRVSLAQTANDLPPDPPVTAAGNDPCGMVDIETNPTLPLLADGLLQHTSAFSGPQTMMVQLPAGMTCTNCVLQVVQYMSKHPQPCYYHHCATVTVTDNPVPAVDGANPGGDAGIDPGGGGDPSGGCCSTNREDAPGTMLLGIAIGAGLLLRRRRR